MKLRVSLCAVAAVFLWANVSKACGFAHDAPPLNVVEQEREVVIAAEREASSLTIAAELAADAYRTAVVFAAEREATFLAIAAELAADAHRTTGFALPAWALLLDHEGENFRLLTRPELAAAADEADGVIHRFVVEDENAGSVSPEPEVSFNFEPPETPASIVVDVTASIPEQAAEDADVLETAWMPMSLLEHEGDDEIVVADAGDEVHAASLAFIAETQSSPGLAADGFEDR